ncbi:MAG: acetate/propionate family kinase [Burkholderiaceae bacterium]
MNQSSKTPSIVVINAGSSSIKFALYASEDLQPLGHGSIEGIGPRPTLHLSDALAGAWPQLPVPPANAVQDELLVWLLDLVIAPLPVCRVIAVGHRVVHGGLHHARPMLVTEALLDDLEALVPLAPLHEPYNIAGIRAAQALWPDVPQIACFDTAFHRGQDRLHQLFPIPRNLTESGILRFGFHGLSYDYIAGALPAIAGERAKGRVIIAHLGSGASMCALHGLRSVSSTMGFTALEGLMMARRSGSIDPGLVLHLIERLGMAPEEVGRMLRAESGLYGVSELSDDVRTLQASDDPRALEALDLFALRARQAIGSLAATNGGLDVLVFTAGIGEHSAPVRRRICEDMQWLGIDLDLAANEQGQTRISRIDSPVDVFVIPTNEEIVIARATAKLLAA